VYSAYSSMGHYATASGFTSRPMEVRYLIAIDEEAFLAHVADVVAQSVVHEKHPTLLMVAP
jgi:hypothetical protein